MRLETLPLILGILVALPGFALIADAWLPDGSFVPTERRRRERAERSRAGEAVVGVGILCVAAALVGRDSFRFATIIILAGVVLVTIGTVMNWRLLRELVTHRGPARRNAGGAPSAPPVAAGDDAPKRMRPR